MGYAIGLNGTLPPYRRKIVGGESLSHDSEIPKLPFRRTVRCCGVEVFIRLVSPGAMVFIVFHIFIIIAEECFLAFYL